MPARTLWTSRGPPFRSWGRGGCSCSGPAASSYCRAGPSEHISVAIGSGRRLGGGCWPRCGGRHSQPARAVRRRRGARGARWQAQLGEELCKAVDGGLVAPHRRRPHLSYAARSSNDEAVVLDAVRQQARARGAARGAALQQRLLRSENRRRAALLPAPVEEVQRQLRLRVHLQHVAARQAVAREELAGAALQLCPPAPQLVRLRGRRRGCSSSRPSR